MDNQVEEIRRRSLVVANKIKELSHFARFPVRMGLVKAVLFEQPVELLFADCRGFCEFLHPALQVGVPFRELRIINRGRTSA